MGTFFTKAGGSEEQRSRRPESRHASYGPEGRGGASGAGTQKEDATPEMESGGDLCTHLFFTPLEDSVRARSFALADAQGT